MNNSWYSPLAAVASLGSQHKGDGSLAGLHEAREAHLSQFFTPADVAAAMWRIASPAIDAAIAARDGARVALFDNSVGSGRLLQFANPEKHTLAGFDVHQASVEQVGQVATAAGFSTDFIVAGMEEVRPRGYGVALINPPFSINLQSPHMEDYPCCSFGKFGPGTSCVSHAYAVAQALEAADIVVAVLPATFAQQLSTDAFFSERLRMIAKLPGTAFESEGASVSTAIAVWDAFPRNGDLVTVTIKDLSNPELPALDLSCRTERQSRPAQLSRRGVDYGQPSITLPVTGNKVVRVVRHNRRVILKFACGLTEAKVMNAVLRERANAGENHRLPARVRFAGQGVLDLQVHLMQENPVQSFSDFTATIRRAGGEPNVDLGIVGYLRRHAKRIARHRVPLAHTIRAEGAQLASGEVELTARETFLLNPKVWGSPIVKRGQVAKGVRAEAGKWTVTAGGKDWTMIEEEVNKRFAISGMSGANGTAWIEKFPGRLAAFPEIAREARMRAEKLGINKWLSWDFQMDDLVEVAISPYGAVPAWHMGLGKTRLALALILLGGGKHNLFVTEPHLVPEVVQEIEGLGLPAELWRVIDSPEAVKDLRKINVISYNRLRLAVNPNRPKATYGKALRRRIGTMICDEGHVLRNMHTAQTQAAWVVSARRRFVLTGTLVANYPRDTMAILAWVGGSATAAQPYGIRSDAYLEPRMATSMSFTSRGVDAYRDTFVTLEWCTSEFAEDNTQGAKREVPKIANLPAYRAMLAPWVKRRVIQEPAVAKHVKIPEPSSKVIPVKWTDDHLGFYLDVADNFASWYRNAKREAGERGNNLNLVALLARIGAVETACNVPHAGCDEFGAYTGLTAKQSFAVQHIAELAKQGEKVIVYAKRPQLLERMGDLLDKEGVKSVLVHGGRGIEERTRDLRENYRKGDTNVLLASEGCVQTGLNLPETTRIVHLSRSWSAKTERQANARALRPQQKRHVVIEYIHLPGSIDDYQAQMIAFKADAADAGVDWATPEKSNEEFAHIDTILGRFVEDIAKMRGTTAHELRRSLVAAA